MTTVKQIRIARITMLQAILMGDSDVAYTAARRLARLSEDYLFQNYMRVLPRF